MVDYVDILFEEKEALLAEKRALRDELAETQQMLWDLAVAIDFGYRGRFGYFYPPFGRDVIPTVPPAEEVLAIMKRIKDTMDQSRVALEQISDASTFAQAKRIARETHARLYTPTPTETDGNAG